MRELPRPTLPARLGRRRGAAGAPPALATARARAWVCSLPRGRERVAAWERCALALLDDRQRRRLRQLGPPAARLAYAAGQLLVRHALAAACGLRPTAFAFSTGALGRPEVVEPAAARGWVYSISHCPGAVGCALSRGAPVGLDLEPRGRSVRHLEALAGRLHPREAAALARVPRERQQEWFLRLWTLKEAFAKALGLGLRLPLAATHLSPGRPRAAALEGAGESPAAWRFRQALTPSGHWLAVAVGSASGARGPPPLRLWLHAPPTLLASTGDCGKPAA